MLADHRKTGLNSYKDSQLYEVILQQFADNTELLNIYIYMYF